MRQIMHSFSNFFSEQENLSLSLFNSEGFYWLTTATALAFAAEELIKYTKIFPEVCFFQEEPVQSEPFIDLFKASIKTGETSEEVKKEAQRAALHNLQILADFAKNTYSFDPQRGLILGKTFATYWLIYKLIELEWQQILNREETNETYMLLDTVIMDHEELEILEGTCKNGTLSPDNRVYLRSHWERVRYFWINLHQDLLLLANGYINFSTPYKG
ncbi:MAG: hypothetical protein ACOWWO_06105 [Peptococcaceae bacterium]